MQVTTNRAYKKLITDIGQTLQQARENAVRVVNQELVIANWKIGQHIVEFEQKGKEKAEYGSSLLAMLSNDLKKAHGKGFSKSSIYLCRQFYLKFPKFQTVSGKFKTSKFQTVSGKSKKPIRQRQSAPASLLSWSHYAELVTVSDDLARSFYEKQAIRENWSFREMKRQIDAALFERLALSKNKRAVLTLAAKGYKPATAKDAVRDPYIFEFLQIKSGIISEKGLEKKLIGQLQHFLLELGKGFTFIGRQYKISIDNEHHYIDLVFYHRILRCFILIDLKTKKVKHQDIGQMNMYLNYFKEEENAKGDNPPIGIIIAADKHELLVKYATGGLSNKIFVSKYQLYLPDQKLLEKKVKQIINNP